MFNSSDRYICVPVVIARTSPGRSSICAMIHEDAGKENLSSLRNALRREARLRSIDPDSWTKLATDRLLSLYHAAYKKFVMAPGVKNVLGFVLKAQLPSGTTVLMCPPEICPDVRRRHEQNEHTLRP